MQDWTLQRREEALHERLGVCGACLAERATDVADETDSDRAKLILLSHAERVRQERKECRQVLLEVGLEGGGQGTDGQEGIFDDRRLLAGGLDELEQQVHHAVGQGGDFVTEATGDALRTGAPVSKFSATVKMSSLP